MKFSFPRINPFTVCLIFVGLILSLSAFAETPSLTVTLTNDAVDSTDGQTSLREALAYAATLSGTQTITFSGQTANGAVNFYDGTGHTITLTNGELAISTSLTIQGPGPNLLSISGNSTYRVFNITGNTTDTLAGLTITRGGPAQVTYNGFAPVWTTNYVQGGGIYNNQGNLTLSNVNVANNLAAAGISAWGGGIYNKSGSVTLINCKMTDNSAFTEVSGNGGAIYNDQGSVSLINSTISGNSALSEFTSIGIAGGGAIYNYGTLNINNTTISNSLADAANQTWGGAIYNRGTINISNGVLSGNSAQNEGGLALGGGIYNDILSSISISNSTVSGNSATNAFTTAFGGGIYDSYGSTISIVNSTFSGNSAIGGSTAFGGGIFNSNKLDDTVAINIINSTFSSNTAVAGANAIGAGGGIYNSLGEAVNVINSTFSGNVATGSGTNSFTTGGGIFNAGTPLNIIDSTISGNSATATGTSPIKFGGGIYNFGIPVTLANSIVAGNDGGSTPDIYLVFISGGLPELTSRGYNLIGNTNGSSGWVASDLLNTSPLLGPLQNNGGPTFTMALLPGSPAINAGNNSLAVDQNGNPLTTDQRGTGHPRVSDSAVDIGAFEFSFAPTITSADHVTFTTGLASSFTIAANGFPTPKISTLSSLPAGVTLVDNGNGTATLAGMPTDGSGGDYFISIVATNGSLPDATQNFALHVVEKSALIPTATFNTNGLAWTSNGGPTINSNALTLTDGAGAEGRSGWFRYPLYIGAFHATFTYQDVGGGGADGVAFVLQNDPRGTAALGDRGGSLGYGAANPITPSAALELNIFNGNGQTIGYTFLTNGLTGAGGANGNYHPTGAVNPASGHPINVALDYSGSQLALTFTDTISSASFTTNLTVGSLTSIVGGQTAYVGFTGADGGVGSTQLVTNFSFTSIPTASISATGANVFVSYPATMAGFKLQRNSDLGTANWVDLTTTPTIVNGQNQFTVPPTATQNFYRLKLSSQ